MNGKGGTHKPSLFYFQAKLVSQGNSPSIISIEE